MLALVWTQRGERLTLREREELRRKIAIASELLGWTHVDRPSGRRASKDVLDLMRSGARALSRELAGELASKERELCTLKSTARSISKLAKEADFTEPLEVRFSHTAKRPPLGTVTKTEALTLRSAGEAAKAAREIEANLEGWGKLQAEMLEDLRQNRRQLDETKRRLPALLAKSEDLIRHVLDTLY